MKREHGIYKSESTAAHVYDLICRLTFNDQLDKTPHLLNFPNDSHHATLVEKRDDDVQIWRLDGLFLVIYEEQVRSNHETVGGAQRAAKVVVENLEEEQAEKEMTREKVRKKLDIIRNKDGIAYVPVTVKGKTLEVLLSDNSWLDIHAAGGKRVTKAEVVDHLNRNPLDNRLDNFRITDYSTNAQNIVGKGSGMIGVGRSYNLWRMQCQIKGKVGTRSRYFALGDLEKAIRLYDLVALAQHGVGCRLNHPEKVADYLAELDEDETKELVQDFITGEPKAKTVPYNCVFAMLKKGRKPKMIHRAKRQDDGLHAMELDVGLGSAIRCAIHHDLWRLKVKGEDFRVNFGQLRPCYLHWLPILTTKTQKRLVEEGYKRLGGDRFAREQEMGSNDTSTSSSRSSSSPITSSSSSTLGKRPTSSR